MEASQSRNAQVPLMLIHGAWLSARSCENYADYFGKRGFAVSAPEWPRKQGDYLEFEGRPHLQLVAPDLEEVAAPIDSWLDGVLDTPLPATDQA